MNTVWKHPRSTWPNVWMGWTYGAANASQDTVANRVQQLSAPFDTWALIDQTHSDIVKHVTVSGSQGEGDAQFTAVGNIGLVVQTADCVPIFLIGKQNGSLQVGVVHAGWRGVANQIVKRSVEQMSEVHTAIIGPCIGVNRYEVGEEVIDAIVATGVPREVCTQERSPRPHLDVRLAVAHQLRSSHVRNIETAGFCTYKDMGWSSYRRDAKKAGRILSIIGVLNAD